MSGEPVVTCLRAFFILHARLRVRRAPGIPCALCFFEGHESGIARARTAARRRKCVYDLSCPDLPPSLKLRRPSELLARRSLGGDGIRASINLRISSFEERWITGSSPVMTKTKSGSRLFDILNQEMDRPAEPLLAPCLTRHWSWRCPCGDCRCSEDGTCAWRAASSCRRA